MASIDEVIARSRQKGEFTERRSFTVARQSAIRKMRKFALADPFFYILELIQAAIANGATYIDIMCNESSPQMTFSYVGGGFSEGELSQIFDFLFASKDNLDVADIRQLALGINALLLSEPDEIAIESGKGTLESTTRVVINPGRNTVDVGTPTAALDGTFVSVTGMSRRKLGHNQIREGMVIEERCLTAPVPLLYNNQPIFGYRTMRSPNIFGYSDTITFDEGDLYGTLGIARTANQTVVKLLTYGVWIEAVKPQLDGSCGGVVAFDKLRKTADHAGVVKDDVYLELWARLRPYARQLFEGKTGKAVFQIRQPGGPDLSAVEIRELGTKSNRLVVFDRQAVTTDERRELLREFSTVLDAPVLVAESSDKSVVELVAHDDVQVLMPELEREALDFYRRPETPEPEKPWLTAPVEVEPVTIARLGEWLDDAGVRRPDRTGVLAGLPRNKEVRGQVYTLVEDRAPGELSIEVRTSNRIIWQGSIRSSSPGHVLVVEIDDVPPTKMSEHIEEEISVARLVGEVMAQHAREAIEEASAAVISSIAFRELTPENSASRIVLAASSRAMMKRVRVTSGANRVILSVVDESLPVEVMDQPILRTLDGESKTIRHLEDMLNQHGLIYGVVPEVKPDLDGLDTSQILDLDLPSEEAILGMVGEASYVRVDKRDILAETAGVVVRDIAIGIRDYPDFPLLIEGHTGQLDAGDVNVIGELVTQLKTLYLNRNADEEFRRQAARHLIYYLGHTRQTSGPDAPTFGIEKLPLFRDGAGAAVSFDTAQSVVETRGRLAMLDGWAVDTAGLGNAASVDESAFVESGSLAMNPFILISLKPLEWLTPSFDFELTERETHEVESDQKFLVRSSRDDSKLQGTIGIPVDPVEYPAISLVATADKRVWPLRSAAVEFGIVGRLMTNMSVNSADAEAIENWCMTAGYQMIADLSDELPSLPDEHVERATRVLLTYAARHLEFVQTPEGKVKDALRDNTAARILAIPLFRTRDGLLVSGQRVVRVFVESFHVDHAPTWQEFLADDCPDYILQWCEAHLSTDSVVFEPRSSAETETTRPTFTMGPSDDEIARWLAAALASLRPDSRRNTRVVFGVPDEDRYQLETGQTIYMPAGQPFGYHDEGEEFSALVIRPDHPLVEQIRENGASLREMGWLLMASYAYINEVLQEVTNEHELEFQARIVDYLADSGVIGGRL